MSLQVGGGREVALDHRAAIAHDDDDLGDARRDQSLHVVLDQRDAGDGEHLFGDRFGRRQETGAVSSDGDDAFHGCSSVLDVGCSISGPLALLYSARRSRSATAGVRSGCAAS